MYCYKFVFKKNVMLVLFVRRNYSFIHVTYIVMQYAKHHDNKKK